MAMDGKLSGRKARQDDDIDVDHYFLPGGILDTPSHEEDMIGGSLLDEIGGVGNVNVSVHHHCHGCTATPTCENTTGTRTKPVYVLVEQQLARKFHTIPFPLLPQLLPAKQMTVSRIVGSEARSDVPSTGMARLEPRDHKKPTGSVIRGGPT